jgi:hypothetical protein
MTKPISWYARRYVEKFGMHLVPIDPGRKFPRAEDWGNNTLSDPQAAENYYLEHSDWNMGLVLGPSNICSLDIDCMDSFRLICECFNIDIDDLIKKTPTIQGRGFRLMFRVPEGVKLDYHRLNWKKKDDPSKSYTVIELRAACDGKQRQDVLPPSMHPDTGKPYVWFTQPTFEMPEPPLWLLAIWKDWDKFRPQMQAMCPWADVSELPKPPKTQAFRERFNEGDGVIDQYIASVSLESALAAYGYKRIGKRWLSPHSQTKLPGVVVFEHGNSCWVHHASDPLCSDDSGRPVNAFDLYCMYEHQGDIKRAVKALAPHKQHVHVNSPVVTEDGEILNEPFKDTLSLLPYTTERGKPIKNIDNLKEICKRLNVTIRYNVIKKEEEILIPNQKFSIDNEANASFAWILSECAHFNYPTDKVGDFMTYLADQNLYNPVANWVLSKPWDNVSRLNDFYSTIKSVGEDTNPTIKTLKQTLIKRWMISAIAAAFNPNGVSAAGVLVLQGAQYVGKTKWFKSLVPPELKLLKDGMILRPDDKDSVKQACSFWLVELGELDATFRKSDIAALKAFITNDSDVLRRPYARKESTFARRTVFFGSVNPRDYLHDPTGNRRYWTIECSHIDHSHNLDMQQVWAEFYQLYKGGEGYYLTADEMAILNTHNEGFTAPDPVEERVYSMLDWEAPQTIWRWIQVSEVLIECGIDRPTKNEAATAGTLIRKLNIDQSKRVKGRTLMLCPPKLIKY